MNDNSNGPTKTERLILKNQFAILEFLARAFPDTAQRGQVIYHDADTYQWYQEILSHGYESLMREIFAGIYDIDLNYQEQKDILNILDMWNDLQWSYERLEDKQDLKETDVRFPGWDGNSLKGELSFARLFCYRRGEGFGSTGKENIPDRFSQVKPSPAHNSHGPFEQGYHRMLAVYMPLKERLLSNWRPFTYEEIRSVLDAFAHPDSPRGRELRGLASEDN